MREKSSSMRVRRALPTLVSSLLASLLLSACAGLPSTRSSIAFDPQEVAWAMATGNNTLRGSARMHEPGGEWRTCAGASVAVLPDSAYTRARLIGLYGSEAGGRNDMSPGAMRRVDDADPRFAKVARLSTCDIRGAFHFSGLADGTWYVTTSIVWRTRGNDPASQTGAALMQRVTLDGGRTVSVTLSPGPGD